MWRKQGDTEETVDVYPGLCLKGTGGEAMTRFGAARFPPEYQAQLIEEMSADRSFRALQALDVEIGPGLKGLEGAAGAVY